MKSWMSKKRRIDTFPKHICSWSGLINSHKYSLLNGPNDWAWWFFFICRTRLMSASGNLVMPVWKTLHLLKFMNTNRSLVQAILFIITCLSIHFIVWFFSQLQARFITLQHLTICRHLHLVIFVIFYLFIYKKINSTFLIKMH